MSDPVFTLPQPESWKTRAACVGLIEQFDADGHAARAENRPAVNKCRNSCPVLNECRLFALEHRPSAGIWAGEVLSASYSTRANAFRRMADAAGVELESPRGGRPASRPCGTRAGYDRHRYNGETPCDACRSARADQARERKQREAS